MMGARWIARAVLRAWPRQLRERHGRAFAQTFAQSWRDARGGPGIWQRAALVADGIGSGWSERRARRPLRDWRLSMRSISSEAHAAWRALVARPLPTLAIVATLGIGLGTTVAMFAVMDAVLLRPLPYPDDGRLMTMTERNATRPLSGVSLPGLQEWAGLDGVTSIGAFEDGSGILRSAVEPVRVEGVMTSPAFFQTLGVAAALGRTPVPGDPLLDPDPKIVLSDRLWRQEFATRANVLGEIVRIDNRSYTVIGVMPAGFAYPARASYWTTFSPDMKMLLNERGLRFLEAIARVSPGTSVAALNSQLKTWADRSLALDAKAMTGWSPIARPLRDEAVGALRQPISVTFAGVGVLLLIACCNVAALLLAQSRTRQHAFAVQTALGASRARLITQLLLEGLLMSAASVALALLVAASVRSAIVALSVDQIPRIDLVQMDVRVVLFAVLTAVITTLLFALGPAVSASHVDGGALMGRSTRTVAGDRRPALSVLVASEFALALILVAAAGLLINSYLQLQRVDVGFTPANAAVARVTIPLGAPWNAIEARRRLLDDLLTRVRAIGGVDHAAVAARLPLEPSRGGIDGWPAGRKERAVPFVLQEVSEDYFGAIGGRLIEGRDFSADDRHDRPVVVVINDAAARQWWPGESAIGKTLEYDFMRGRMSAEVIGVINAVKYDGLGGAVRPELYTTFRQGLVMPASLVVRADSPLTHVAAIRAALRAADPTGAVIADGIAAFDDRVAAQLARPRFFLALFGTFAALAFVLAAIGIYGTLSFWIAERRRELGIRLALGATRAHVARLVVGRGLGLAGIGLIVGLVATLASGRYVRSLLFAVSPSDPLTLCAAAALLGAVAAVTCWLPARRAAAVDPLETLRD